jgi:hypothetical protein
MLENENNSKYWEIIAPVLREEIKDILYKYQHIISSRMVETVALLSLLEVAFNTEKDPKTTIERMKEILDTELLRGLKIKKLIDNEKSSDKKGDLDG